MLGPKDHANALGTRGSALALEGEAVARGIAHHSIIPLFHARRCAETYCPLFQHSIIPLPGWLIDASNSQKGRKPCIRRARRSRPTPKSPPNGGVHEVGRALRARRLRQSATQFSQCRRHVRRPRCVVSRAYSTHSTSIPGFRWSSSSRAPASTERFGTASATVIFSRSADRTAE